MTIKFEPRDVWIGLYWTRNRSKDFDTYIFYVCLIPFLPISWVWKRKR